MTRAASIGKLKRIEKNRDVIPQDKTDLFLKLQPKQLKFIIEYLKNGGDGCQAWMKIYRVKNNANAAHYASRFLQSHLDIKQALYEMWGFSEKEIITTLAEAKKAERQQIYRSKVYSFPDHYARMKAIELAKKLSGGIEAEDKGSRVNVMIINDPANGIWKVQDNS